MSRTHGLPGTYVSGCRCEACTEANRVRGAAVRAQLAAEPRDRVPHGTRGGYTNWGCRCAECTAANTAACAAARRTRLGLRPLAVVVVALAAMAAGTAGTDAAILARRHYGPPPVTRPVPAPNPSPVLTSTGGAR